MDEKNMALDSIIEDLEDDEEIEWDDYECSCYDSYCLCDYGNPTDYCNWCEHTVAACDDTERS